MSRGQLGRQVLQFGAVGGAGLVVDVAAFNYLSLTVLSAHLVAGGPLWAKAVSTSLAVLTNWMGNRWVTFRTNRRSDIVREAGEFVLVSLGGALIAIVCLGVSHYGLGFTSPLSDNIATNIVGLALGSAFRFVVYRNWVYSELRSSPQRRRSGV